MNDVSKNSVALLIAVGLCLNACSQVRGAPSAQATDVIPQPVTVKPQYSKMGQTAAQAPAGSQVSSSSLPFATSNSGVFPPVLVSDHSQTLAVAQHTYRLLTHIQRIEAANKQTAEETTEWWELRNSKDQVIYREAYPETNSVHVVSAGRSEEFLFLQNECAPRELAYELSELGGQAALN